MLSPGVGQVTPALLTRPPLKIHKIWPKSPQRISPVRLACVKHAASVHPEPGSNSLKKFWLRQNLSAAAQARPRLCLFWSGSKQAWLLSTLKVNLFEISLYYLVVSFDTLLKISFVRSKSRRLSSLTSGIPMLRIVRILPSAVLWASSRPSSVNLRSASRCHPFFLNFQGCITVYLSRFTR